MAKVFLYLADWDGDDDRDPSVRINLRTDKRLRKVVLTLEEARVISAKYKNSRAGTLIDLALEIKLPVEESVELLGPLSFGFYDTFIEGLNDAIKTWDLRKKDFRAEIKKVYEKVVKVLPRGKALGKDEGKKVGNPFFGD